MLRSLFAHIRPDNHAVAFDFDDRSLTYAQLFDEASRYALALRNLGVDSGARVAVYSASTDKLLVALVGNYMAGVIHVPINTRYRTNEVAHILSDADPAVVVYDKGGAEVVEPLLGERIGVAMDTTGPDGVLNWSDIQPSLAEAAAAGSVNLDRRSDEEIALLIYTSGTTGRSKGVALSYRAVVSNIRALTGLWQWTQADVLCLALPLFHVHGLGIGVHGTLLHGMRSVVLPRFDSGRVAASFAGGSPATIFMGVPTMYAMLLEHLEAEPEAASLLKNARLFTSGSAALPAAHHQQFQALTGHSILERYGMSETMLTLSNPYDGERRAGTVGFPVPGGDVQVRGDDGSVVAPGEIGEIYVSGDSLLTEYWGIATPPVDDDGWFQTGDVATRDAEGYVSIIGRKSADILKSGGFKISAREIEDVLIGHPAVREVAVVGLPDEKWGQRIVAAVVLRDDADAESAPSVLDAHCIDALADFKRPRAYHQIAEIPRNALGKVQKHKLIAQLVAEG